MSEHLTVLKSQYETPESLSDGKEFDSSIPALFEEQVDAFPDKVAVKDEKSSFTYFELNSIINQVAHAILRLDEVSETPIMAMGGYGSPAIIALMAILKTGRPYIIVGSSDPQDRIREILIDSQTNLIVTDNQNLSRVLQLDDKASDIPKFELINIDEIGPESPIENPSISISPEKIGYIYYTSGSTGKPKGVFNNHRNIILGIQRFHKFHNNTSEDRFLLGGSLNFAASTSSIFGALLNGGSVFPFSIKDHNFTELKEWLQSEKISFCFFVPSAFRKFMNSLKEKDEFPNMRVVRLGGEAIYKDDVDLFRKYFPKDSILGAGLASTDAGGICYYAIDNDTDVTGEVVPVGIPVPGVEVLLLDDDFQPVGENEIGEIVVRSHYLPLGYWNRPDLNREKYLPDPDGSDKRMCLTGDLGRFRPDGLFEHISRKDTMVKIRGLRIETTEIEAHLLALETIKDVVVVAQEDRFKEKRLVAYVVPSVDTQPSIIDLREIIAEKLPDYMIPSTFVFLETLPRTSSGKVNKLALPEPPKGRLISGQEYIAPRNDMESKLVQLFEKHLEVQPVGIKDDFIELGGHSLVAIQIITEIEDTLHKSIPMNDFINALNVEKLAENLQTLGAKPISRYLVVLQPKGEKSPFFCIPPAGVTSMPFKILSKYMGEDRPFYSVEYAGMYGETEPHKSVADIAKFNNDLIRTIQPEGPYHLAGMCYGAIVAYEMAHQLVDMGQEVAFIGILDSRNLPAQKVRLLARLIKLMVDINQNIFKGKLPIGLKGSEHRMTQVGVDASVLPHVSHVFETHAYAHLCYTAPPIPTVLTLFMTEWNRSEFMKDQWQKASSKGLDLVIIPGIHLPRYATEDMEPTFLSEPNVQEVAKLLNNSLDKAGLQYQK